MLTLSTNRTRRANGASCGTGVADSSLEIVSIETGQAGSDGVAGDSAGDTASDSILTGDTSASTLTSKGCGIIS